jgi:tetratricopeptide (TPR) repeat protein
VRERSGDTDQALADFEAALAIQQRLLPPQHPTLAITLNNIGTVHAESGELDTALDYFERSLAIRTASYPAGHPRLATAHLNLGTTYSYLERYDEARAALARALDINRRNLPPDHPDIAFVLGSLAAVDHNSKDYAAAAAGYAEVLRMREAKLAPDHAELGRAQLNLGLALAYAGELERGVEHLEAAVDIYAQNGANARERHIRALFELGHVRRELGDDAGSVAAFEAAVHVAGEPDVEPLTLGLARWYLAQNLWDLAPRRRDEAIEIMRASYVDYAEHGEPGDNDEVVEWLRERGAEPPKLPDGHPTNVTPEPDQPP